MRPEIAPRPHRLGLLFWQGGGGLKTLLGDFTGAFGDLGIFIPIAVGLMVLKGFSCPVLLFWTGLVYWVTGVWAKIPMPVQPWKAACILFLVSSFSVDVLFASSLLLGSAFLFLGITGLIQRLGKLFPSWLICGIQLGLGLVLVQNGIHLALFGLATPAPSRTAVFSLTGLEFGIPPAGAFWTALIFIVPAQFALSLGNSVFAAADTAKRYFGAKAQRVNEKTLCLSLGCWNVAAGFLGVMPVCHGSTGITAHYKLGARTFLCNFVIGATFLLAAFWPALQARVMHIAAWLLGLLLVYVGVQHALLVRRQFKSERELLGTLVMGLASVWSGHVLLGMAVGLAIVLGTRWKKIRHSKCSGHPSYKAAYALANNEMGR